MILLGPGGIGAIVLLRCPSCGEVQARTRAPKDTKYECRKCHHSFSAEGATVPFHLRDERK